MVFEFYLGLILWILLGIFISKYLIVHPLESDRYLFLTALLIGLILFLNYLIEVEIYVILYYGLGIIGLISGYIVMTVYQLKIPEESTLPQITPPIQNDKKGHIAIIYMTHGEPESYNPIGWILQFHEFDSQKIPFIPLIARPLFLFSLRRHYLRVGSSHHRLGHQQIIAHLEQSFRQQKDDTTKFYLSFLDDTPNPDHAVIQAINDGATRIIVLEVFVTRSNHTKEGESMIEALNLGKYGITPEFTEPLWNSQLMPKLFVERVEKHRNGLEKNDIGILLVGHGQPDEWDIEFPTETEQEILFRENIKNEFVKNGYDPNRILFAWMEFKSPKPKVAINQILKLGIKKLFYFASSISADSIHSQYDIPTLVEKAKIPKEIEVINLGAWNNDPNLLTALKERIDKKLNTN